MFPDPVQVVVLVVGQIHDAANNVRAVPKNAKRLAEQADRCRSRIEMLQQQAELQSVLGDYLGGIHHELKEVHKFLLALGGKSKLSRFVKNRNIQATFEEFNERLRDCRDELNADITAYLAKVSVQASRQLKEKAVPDEPEFQIDAAEVDITRNKELKILFKNGGVTLYTPWFSSKSQVGQGKK